jgi:hypothetical protein
VQTLGRRVVTLSPRGRGSLPEGRRGEGEGPRDPTSRPHKPSLDEMGTALMHEVEAGSKPALEARAAGYARRI